MRSHTQQEIRDLLKYVPETGAFVWRISRGRCASGALAGYDADRGYRAIRVNGRIEYSHRLAFLYMTGTIPDEVDHINGMRSDNRWHNLRESNRLENSKNMQVPSTNKSGVIGVFWNSGKKKWTARIKVNQRDIHLGHFVSFEAAVNSRKVAERTYGFHGNHGRKAAQQLSKYAESVRDDFSARGVLLSFPEGQQ